MRLPSHRAHACLIAAALSAGALGAAFERSPAPERVTIESPGARDGSGEGLRPATRTTERPDGSSTTTSTTPATDTTGASGRAAPSARPTTTGATSPETTTGEQPASPGDGPPPERPSRIDDGGMFDPLDWTPGPVLTGGAAPCVATSASPLASGLLVLDLAAGCLRVLIESNHQPNGAPSWAPDGTWLLTVDDYNRPVRIAADGSWYQVLSSGYFPQAALSPDGGRIAALAMQPDGTGQLVTVGVDGTGARHVANFTWPALDGIRWSPDGRYVVLNSHGGIPGSGGVTVVAADGSGTWRFDGTGAYPMWSPDGLLAIFVASVPSMGVAFRTHDVGAGGPSFSAPNASYDWIEWLDGHRLLFSGRDEGENIASTTFVLDVPTGQVDVALDDATMARVGPDGRTLAYAQRDPRTTVPLGIGIGTIGGSQSTVWTVGGQRPSNWLLAPPAWSPDGGRLALAVLRPF